VQTLLDGQAADGVQGQNRQYPIAARARDKAAALGAKARHSRRHAAEVWRGRNAILDVVTVMVTDVLRRRGFALLAPVAARIRTAEDCSTGIEVAVRLKHPSHADAARAALLERFPIACRQ
jgi:hypothetical protein